MEIAETFRNRFETGERFDVIPGAVIVLSGDELASGARFATERDLVSEPPGVVFAKKGVRLGEPFEKGKNFGLDERIRLNDKGFEFAVFGKILPIKRRSEEIRRRLQHGSADLGKDLETRFFFPEASDKRLRFRVLRRGVPTDETGKNRVTERDGDHIATSPKEKTAIMRKRFAFARPMRRTTCFLKANRFKALRKDLFEPTAEVAFVRREGRADVFRGV